MKTETKKLCYGWGNTYALPEVPDDDEQNLCVAVAVADEDAADPYEVLRAAAPGTAERAVPPPRQQRGSSGPVALENHERTTRHGWLQEVQRQGELGHERRQGRRRWLQSGGRSRVEDDVCKYKYRRDGGAAGLEVDLNLVQTIFASSLLSNLAKNVSPKPDSVKAKEGHETLFRNRLNGIKPGSEFY